MTSRTVRRSILGLLTAATLGACASPPPRELVAARSSYSTASSGGASELAPGPFAVAHDALEQAELSYSARGGDQVTRELAYVATSRSQDAAAAAAAARINMDRARTAQVERERLMHAAQLRATDAELAQSRDALAAQQAALGSSQAQLDRERAAREEQERTAQADIDRERQGRIAAEQSAQAAMDSLRQIAQVREEQRGVVITLSGEVLFVTGQATLLPIAQQRLDQVATALREYHSGQVFTVEGHTDSRGAFANNEALSQARAQAVRDYLVQHGVPSDRIRAEGYGPQRPVADNSTPEGRANNRRVEIVVQPAARGMGGGPAMP